MFEGGEGEVSAGVQGGVMRGDDVREKLERIMEKDVRYETEAYRFVSEALDFTIRSLQRENYEDEEKRHVSGGELLDGIREYGLKKFGPMTRAVLDHWGINSCDDFGEIVFNLVGEGILRKTQSDSREDFKEGYNFHEAFEKPFEV